MRPAWSVSPLQPAGRSSRARTERNTEGSRLIMASLPHPMPYPLELLRQAQQVETSPKPPTTAKTALPVRGTPEERAVRHCVRTLQEVADWLDSQPASALALRPGSLRVSLADTLAACKTAVRVINEGFEEEL